MKKKEFSARICQAVSISGILEVFSGFFGQKDLTKQKSYDIILATK